MSYYSCIFTHYSFIKSAQHANYLSKSLLYALKLSAVCF